MTTKQNTKATDKAAGEAKEATPKTGLELLREPFPAHQISKLPKPTKKQTDEVRADFKKGVRCQVCGAWHHPNVVHLDYVGHAALTDRLLDCDPNWNWEPVATNEDGTPKFDSFGGLWIKLTVCGVTRLGYGHPDGKTGGDAIKEVIGDALRNAAMRFGAALDLWHKGQLHAVEDASAEEAAQEDAAPAPPKANGQRRQWQPGEHAAKEPESETPFDEAPPEANPDHEAGVISTLSRIHHTTDLDALAEFWRDLYGTIKADPRVQKAKDERKRQLQTQAADPQREVNAP